MKYKKIDKEKYEIYYYSTDDFKSINITTILIDDFNKDNITLDNFISDYLLQTNNTYKDEVSMNKNYLNLYSPRYFIFDTYNRYHFKFYDITFLNEKYVEKDNNKKIIDFYFDIMFNPNVKNNEFDKDNTSLIIDNMKSEYKLMSEVPGRNAHNKALSLISEDISLKYDSKGKKSDLKNINTKAAYKYYLDELKNSKYIVFITGEVDDNLIKNISNHLDKNVNKKNIVINPILEVNPVKKVKTKEVETENNQSIIELLYKIPNMTRRERDIVLPLLNNILGGSSAKLFNNVREKHSLAYYAYSNFYRVFNYLYIYAGIDSKNYDKTLKLIFEEVDNMKKGNITKDEIKSSIKAFESSISSKEEHYYKIVNDMILNVLFDKPSTDEILKEINTVTKKEIVELSNKLELDVNFLLRGVTHEDN